MFRGRNAVIGGSFKQIRPVITELCVFSVMKLENVSTIRPSPKKWGTKERRRGVISKILLSNLETRSQAARTVNSLESLRLHASGWRNRGTPSTALPNRTGGNQRKGGGLRPLPLGDTLRRGECREGTWGPGLKIRRQGKGGIPVKTFKGSGIDFVELVPKLNEKEKGNTEN